MSSERILELIGKFEDAFNKYHKLFLETYPTFSTQEFDFGSPELNDLGMKCQAYLTMLGETPKARMNYIGFCQFFAFDNPVDWYSWKIWIKENNVDHTQYLSISMRIDTEFKRMKEFLSEDMWESYCSLSENEYSISYLQYSNFRSGTLNKANDESIDKEDTQQPSIQVVVNNHPEKVEEQMFSHVESIDKKTSILANIATFIARISGVKI